MSVKERAIKAIESLPAEADLTDVLREVAFLTGVEDARVEIARGEALDSTQAKAKLREWISE